MEITSKRIALLNTLPFKYIRRNSYSPVQVIQSVILFGDDICIRTQEGDVISVTREWRNENWHIHDLGSGSRYLLRLPEDLIVVFCALRPLTPQLLARHSLVGIK